MNSRWATSNEIKERLKEYKIDDNLEKSGIPLAYNDNTLYIDDSETHNLIIGSMGSGKTQAFILPMIRLSQKAKESLVINDLYGELYNKCASSFENNNYNVIALDFNDTEFGNNWNPLSLIYDYYKSGKEDLAMKMLEELGYYLFYEPKNNNSDPFWINTSIDYFTGLVLYLFENAKKEEINLLSIYQFSNELKDENKRKEFINKIDKTSLIYVNVSSTLEAPSETRGSILSVFSQKIRLYVSRKKLTNMICNNDIDIKDLFTKPTALFIISGKTSFSNNLIPLLLSQIIEQANQLNNKKRINLLLDEFDSLIPIRDFASTIQHCRSLNIRFTITINSYAHLNYLYTSEDAKILRYCFGNIIYLLSEDIPTLEEFSKYCGTKIENGIEVPLISIEELRTLKTFNAIISMMRMMPIKSELLPYYKTDWNYTDENKEIPKRIVIETKIYQE